MSINPRTCLNQKCTSEKKRRNKLCVEYFLTMKVNCAIIKLLSGLPVKEVLSFTQKLKLHVLEKLQGYYSVSVRQSKELSKCLRHPGVF